MTSFKESEIFVGLDYGDYKHCVCLFSPATQETKSFEVAHSPTGMAEMMKHLANVGRIEGIAVETPNHLVVDQLLAEGFAVYPVNPKMAKAWRDGWAAHPSKTDAIDARTLAQGLYHHHVALKPLVPDDARTRELAMLCHDEQVMIQRRSGLVSQLKYALKAYYPQALDWFGDWTRKSAWEFVETFPNPDKLRRTTKPRLIRFLREHRIGMKPKWEKLLSDRKESVPGFSTRPKAPPRRCWPCRWSTS